MLNFVAQKLPANADWRALLEAYRSRELEQKGANPAADGWLPRLSGVDGIEPAHLSRLHGKLIALGLLRFEVSGKSGMLYQVSSLGRQTLEGGQETESEAEDSAASVDEPEF